MPTHLGAEPKKLAILGLLLAALGVVYWTNREPALPAPPRPAPSPAIPRLPTPAPRSAPSRAEPARRTATAAGRAIDDFRPTLKLPEGADVSRIDPSLRLELLARVRTIEETGGARSLFEFGQPPPPPPQSVKPIVPGAPAAAEPPQPAAPPSEPPKPPPPPPITLKYYGFAGNPQSSRRRAFFLDGEDIFVAGENEMVRSRYKIVRIGVNSALVEDTTNQNQQTLPLVEEIGG
jgi:hypothetical protein